MTDLDDLRAELDSFAQQKKKKAFSAREERIIAGFEEVQRFVEEQGRVPQHGEERDIFERLYAVRLERIIAQEECRVLVADIDYQGLLQASQAGTSENAEEMDDEVLLAELGEVGAKGEISELRHVRSRAEIRAAEDVANREKCEDFDEFEPLFEKVEADLNAGVRKTIRFGREAGIGQGEFFILGGQTVYVAEKGEEFTTPQGHPDARLRVIYSNGTESNLLLRSLQRALYKDDTGRRISEPNAGPLFGDTWEDDDVESGTIYVLRSLSDSPYIQEHRQLIHKIGVTGGKVEARIANASKDATYLLADVEVVATYKLSGINKNKFEALFHRIFSPAQLDLTIQDRFGNPVKPREWFLVPFQVIDEAVQRIADGSITGLVYDPKQARLIDTAD